VTDRAEIRVPASTSNLGSSFDACGLALGLYLSLRVERSTRGFDINASGEVAGRIPLEESNLIIRVAEHVARSRGRDMPGAAIRVHSEIPLARGLGSSSSAIIAGLSLYEVLADDRLTEDELFRFALEFEDHGDNLAPSMLGGLVVACVVDERQPAGETNSNGQFNPAGLSRRLLTIKRRWPDEVKIVLAIPDYEMDTHQMRQVLPAQVPLADAVFDVQRASLLQALISEHRLELFSEAMRDRLHQPYRIPLAPGLAEVLEMNNQTNLYPGLLGVALSGAGSTMIAFATENFDRISAEMKRRLQTAKITCRTMKVEVDNVGRRVLIS